MIIDTDKIKLAIALLEGVAGQQGPIAPEWAKKKRTVHRMQVRQVKQMPVNSGTTAKLVAIVNASETPLETHEIIQKALEMGMSKKALKNAGTLLKCASNLKTPTVKVERISQNPPRYRFRRIHKGGTV